MDSVSKAPKGTRRAEKKRLWESHKEEIHQVYMTENRTLPETIQILSSRHGINASIRTWKTKLKEWKYDKYSTKDVVQGIPVDGASPEDDADQNIASSMSPRSNGENMLKRKNREVSGEPKRVKVTLAELCGDSGDYPYLTPSDSGVMNNSVDESMSMSDQLSPQNSEQYLDLPHGVSSPDHIHPFPPPPFPPADDLYSQIRDLKISARRTPERHVMSPQDLQVSARRTPERHVMPPQDFQMSRTPEPHVISPMTTRHPSEQPAMSPQDLQMSMRRTPEQSAVSLQDLQIRTPEQTTMSPQDLQISTRRTSEQPVMSLDNIVHRHRLSGSKQSFTGSYSRHSRHSEDRMTAEPSLAGSESRSLKQFEDRVSAEDVRLAGDSHRDARAWRDAASSYLLAIEKYASREGGQASIPIANIRSELAAVYECDGRLDESFSVYNQMISDYRIELRNPGGPSPEITKILTQALTRRADLGTEVGVVQKSGYLSERLNCLHKAAGLFQDNGSTKEALEILQMGLVDYLENGAILNWNAGNRIITDLLNEYPSKHDDPLWSDLSYKLFKLQKAIENKPTTQKWDRLIVIVRIMELAECYSLVHEYGTAELLFLYCKERLMYAPGLWGARKAAFFHNYALHNHRQEKWKECAMNLISALQELAGLCSPESSRGRSIRSELDETRMEMIQVGPSTSTKYGDSEDDRRNIKALISWTEWLLKNPSEETALRTKRASLFKGVRRLRNQSRTMTLSTRASSVSSRSIGMTYSEADFDGFDLEEMSELKRAVAEGEWEGDEEMNLDDLEQEAELLEEDAVRHSRR